MFSVESSRGEISESRYLSGVMFAAATHVAEGEGPVKILDEGREIGSAQQITAAHHTPGESTRYTEFVVIRIKKEELEC